MKLPRIEIQTWKITHNVKILKEKAEKKGVVLAGVTKGVLAHPCVVNAFLEGGLAHLADSRIQNIKRIRDWGFTGVLTLLRAPMRSEVTEFLTHADHCMVSELKTIQNLDEEAERQDKTPGYFLMVDVGDRREGVLPEEVIPFINTAQNYFNVSFQGLAANIGCYSGVLPSIENLSTIVELKNELNKNGIEVPILSGGSTSSLVLSESLDLPKDITQLKIGEGFLTGSDTVTGATFENTYQDAFKLTAEIIELKTKPAVPEGKKGTLLSKQEEDRKEKGSRKRGILAMGRQDIVPSGMHPYNENIRIEGGSSDHMILDLTDVDTEYQVGDQVHFYLSYSGIISGFTSPYIQKISLTENHC